MPKFRFKEVIGHFSSKEEIRGEILFWMESPDWASYIEQIPCVCEKCRPPEKQSHWAIGEED